jgi:hypothetical protein
MSNVITDETSVKGSESARALSFLTSAYFEGGASGRVFPMNPIC